MAASAARSDTSAANDPDDGHAAQATASVGLLRLSARERAPGRTYLRVGREVFPVYGDDVRGWSTLAGDFRGVASSSPFVYASVDELFFALVNLCVGPRGEA
jgi:hypothetical protein